MQQLIIWFFHSIACIFKIVFYTIAASSTPSGNKPVWHIFILCAHASVCCPQVMCFICMYEYGLSWEYTNFNLCIPSCSEWNRRKMDRWPMEFFCLLLWISFFLYFLSVCGGDHRRYGEMARLDEISFTFGILPSRVNHTQTYCWSSSQCWCYFNIEYF